MVDKVTAGAGKRAETVDALLKSLTGWTAKTVWNRFDGTYPHVIPADPAGGLEKDLVLYENAVIFAGGTQRRRPARRRPRSFRSPR